MQRPVCSSNLPPFRQHTASFWFSGSSRGISHTEVIECKDCLLLLRALGVDWNDFSFIAAAAKTRGSFAWCVVGFVVVTVIIMPPHFHA
jgi:hypothetical protein